MVSGGGSRVKDRRRDGDGDGGGGGGSGAHPSSRLLVWHSTFDGPRSRHEGLVRGHALNQQVEVALPTRAGTTVAEALQWETAFYYEVTMSLAVLLSKRFIRDYVQQGAVCMIAKNVAMDSANTAMLLPSGELLLLVDSETYQQLGLTGHKYGQSAIPAECDSAAYRRRRRAPRYLVRVDLKALVSTSEGDDTTGVSTDPAYDRLMECLSTRLDVIEMLVCAYNERGAVRTIIFGDDDSIERKRVELNGCHERFQDIVVPAIDQFYREAEALEHRLDMETMRSSLEGVYDWLGVLACRLVGVLTQEAVEEYVSTFTGQPEHVAMVPASEVSTVRWRGLITAQFVERILSKTREHVLKKDLPWAAVTVWGFADAIVSWQQELPVVAKTNATRRARDGPRKSDVPTEMARKGGQGGQRAIRVENREHGYLGNGSNNYTFVVLPKGEYFVIQELGPHDATK